MADTIYSAFKMKARASGTADDNTYNLGLLFGIISSHAQAVRAPVGGKNAYILFSKGSGTQGKIPLRVTDDLKGGYTATMLPPSRDGSVAESGQDFYGDISKERDFMQSLETAFSW